MQVEHHVFISLNRPLQLILEPQLGRQTGALFLLAELKSVSAATLMVGCTALGEVLTVVTRTTAAYDNRGGHQWWSKNVSSGEKKGLPETTSQGLHGELIPNMRFTSLMMSIAPTLLLIFYVCTGPAEGAPRIYRYDASPVPRKPYTWQNLHTDVHPSSPGLAAGALEGEPESAGAFTPDRRTAAESAATMTPRSSDPSSFGGADSISHPGRDPAEGGERVLLSRAGGTHKRSVESRASLLAPEKMLQTMVSMVSQRTSNDAWAADSIDTSITSSEHIQGSVR